MNTPIVDFVKNYIKKGQIRAHMPGHKGQTFLGFEPFDITEFDGADCLYSASGIIAESEQNASTLFGANTFYSAEGSSLCVRAMLYLALKSAKSLDEKPFVLAGRNAHKSFITALGLLDLDVLWVYPDERDSYLSCSINPTKLDLILSSCKTLPIAVYITTPDYLGNTADVKGISKVCKKFGVKLLVDNAHGAYLKFLTPSQHPIDLGADMCCDSAHKTLPAITGSAYLHLSKDMPKELVSQVKLAMSIFGSTSPSYLILQSLDAVNKYIDDGYTEKLSEFIQEVALLKTNLLNHGYTLIGNEPLKITIKTKDFGYTGIEFNQLLKTQDIITEFYDPDYLVMMVTPETKKSTLEKIKSVLTAITKKQAVDEITPKPEQTEQVISIKNALLSQTETVAVENSLGKIFADISVNCPPAVPIIVCGERIDENTINCLKYYGQTSCKIIK